MIKTQQRNTLTGISLAVLATIIWSGNFIVARGIYKQVPPVSLAFFRWLVAAIILLPFAGRAFIQEWHIVRKHFLYFAIAGMTGVAMFNTFVYIGAQYTSAINLALIGTTTSPIMSVILARIFLKETIGWQKIIGITICVAGVIFLLSMGNFSNLLTFQFTKGDSWVLAAALSFAIYNTMVKRKPGGISALNFVFTTFCVGTLFLFPFYLVEASHSNAVNWNTNLVLIILYLSLGASVICFLIWNMAILKLGAGRAALFGNLIPVFSSLEAVFILNESFTPVHLVSMLLIFIGIVLANIRLGR